MRFGISASVLATAFPVGFALRKQTQLTVLSDFTTGSSQKKKNKVKELLLWGDIEFDDSHPFYEWKRGGRGILKNFRLTGSSTECVPGMEADIGVLDCGTNEYCLEVPDSSLGGICISLDDGAHQRNLLEPMIGEYLCESGNNSGCNCNDWDNTTNTGTIECAQLLLCDDTCGFDFCLFGTKTYSTDGVAGVYTLFYGWNGAYQRYYNITVGRDDDGEYFCEMAINGTACSYCTFVNETCSSYDCRNVDEGYYDCTTGTGKRGTPFDDIPHCKLCDQCSDDEFFVDEDTLVYFPLGNATCGQLSDLMLNYPITCYYFGEFVREGCCEDIFSPTTTPTESFDEISHDEA